MHDNAQWAMVGIVDPLMDVRNLRHRQQGQQNHAHNSPDRIGAGPGLARLE